MRDLIERQKLIDEINRLVKEIPNIKIGTSTFRDGILDAYARVLGIIRSVPSAHSNTSNTLGALDCVEREKAMKIKYSSGFDHDGILYVPYRDVQEHLEKLPSVQPEDWMERNRERILQAGMEGREIEFRIGGRLFAIREKAQ